MPAPASASALLTLVVLGLLPLAAACGPSYEEPPYRLPSAPEGAPRDTPSADPTAHYVFARELPYADRWAESERIEPGRYGARPHLTRGWSYPEGTDDREIEDDAMLWADAREAEITFAVRETGKRELRLRMRSLQSPQEPTGVQLALNGHSLGEVEVSHRGRDVRLEMPAESVVAGLNRLTFTSSHLQRVHAAVEGSKDSRQVSFAAGALRMTPTDDGQAARLRRAERLLPGGVRRAAWSEQAVEQVSGALLRHHLRVPTADAEPRLEGRVVFSARTHPASEQIRMEVVLTPDGGEPHSLWSAELGYRETPRPLQVSLVPWAGQVVRFELRVSTVDEAPEPAVGAWIDLALRAQPAAATAPSEPAPLAACRERLRRAPVIAILLDACNPDYLTPYGGRPGLTPEIERLAEEGVTFDAAYALASYTVSSVASILTSRNVWEHGAWSESTRLASSVPTWPERFRDAGYRTAGIVHTPNGSSIFGYERGFESYAEPFRGKGHRHPPAEAVLAPLEEALAQDDGRPLFLWLHLIEPHAPYHPPAPFAGSLDPDYTGELTGDMPHLSDMRRGALVPDARDMQHLRAEYQEGLAYVDDVLGRVRRRLEQAGLFEEALVLLFSDHGEGFMDHHGKIFAGQGHGSTAYEDMTRTPLILRLPPGAGPRGVRRARTVTNGDLLATAADLVGVPPVADGVGQSFAGLLFDERAPARELVTSHAFSGHPTRFLPVAVALWDGRTKYVHVTGGPSQLFDLEADPGERLDLASERDVLAGHMRERLRREVGVDLDRAEALAISDAETAFDPDALEMLRALGYAR